MLSNEQYIVKSRCSELYIKDGMWSPKETSSYALADVYNDYKDAYQVFLKIPKPKRNLFVIDKIGEQTPECQKPKKDTVDNKFEDFVQVCSEIKEASKKLKEANSCLDKIMNNKKKRIEELSDKINICDKMRGDVLHYLELNTLNCVKLVRCAILLKRISLKRRKYKNMKYVLENLTNDNVKNGSISKKIDAMNERSYMPRVLNNVADIISGKVSMDEIDKFS